MSLYNTFIQEAKRKILFSKGNRILVAFSGGKDSVCLLHLLSRAAKEMKLSLGACHVHHGIRGNEADRDAKFAEGICRKAGIPFFLVKTDVPAFCEKNGIGLEEGARLERYRLLEKVRADNGFDLIATAHNASDQAETVLFRLIRGTGLLGAAGIPEKRDGIIRPLLPFSKENILAYCEKNALTFTEDSTNDDIRITRNRIRSVILPEIKKINQKAEDALNRFATMALWQEKMLIERVLAWKKENSLQPESGILPLEPLKKLVQSESGYPLLYEILMEMTKGTNISIPFERFLGILSLLNEPLEGKIIEICSSHTFSVKNGSLIFDEKKDEIPKKDFYQKIRFGLNYIEAIGQTLTLSHEEGGNVKNINKKCLILEISSDNIEGGMFVRNYKMGDKIRMNGMQKSIKKLFCDAKIPKQYRNRIPLLCDENEILWVPFLGLCDKARDGNGTKKFTAKLEGEETDQIRTILERN